MATRYGALAGVDETIRALSSVSVAISSGLRDVVRVATERTMRAAKAAAPVGRRQGGTTRDAIRAAYFDDGLTGVVFVAQVRDPIRRGLRAKNLPLWLEYGTRKMQPSPFLIPAGRTSGEAMRQASLRVVDTAVRRGSE